MWENRDIKRREREIEEAMRKKVCWWCKETFDVDIKFTVHLRNCERKKADKLEREQKEGE